MDNDSDNSEFPAFIQPLQGIFADIVHAHQAVVAVPKQAAVVTRLVPSTGLDAVLIAHVAGEAGVTLRNLTSWDATWLAPFTAICGRDADVILLIANQVAVARAPRRRSTRVVQLTFVCCCDVRCGHESDDGLRYHVDWLFFFAIGLGDECGDRGIQWRDCITNVLKLRIHMHGPAAI